MNAEIWPTSESTYQVIKGEAVQLNAKRGLDRTSHVTWLRCAKSNRWYAWSLSSQVFILALPNNHWICCLCAYSDHGHHFCLCDPVRQALHLPGLLVHPPPLRHLLHSLFPRPRMCWSMYCKGNLGCRLFPSSARSDALPFWCLEVVRVVLASSPGPLIWGMSSPTQHWTGYNYKRSLSSWQVVFCVSRGEF